MGTTETTTTTPIATTTTTDATTTSTAVAVTTTPAGPPWNLDLPVIPVVNSGGFYINRVLIKTDSTSCDSSNTAASLSSVTLSKTTTGWSTTCSYNDCVNGRYVYSCATAVKPDLVSYVSDLQLASPSHFLIALADVYSVDQTLLDKINF